MSLIDLGQLRFHFHIDYGTLMSATLHILTLAGLQLGYNRNAIDTGIEVGGTG